MLSRNVKKILSCFFVSYCYLTQNLYSIEARTNDVSSEFDFLNLLPLNPKLPSTKCAYVADYTGNMNIVPFISQFGRNAIQRFSCDDVFSSKPNSNITGENVSFWSPFCSLYILGSSGYFVETDAEKAKKIFKEKYNERIVSTETGYDGCTLPKEKVRFNESYQAPSQAMAGVRNMDETELESYKREISKIKNVSKENCCGTDKECMSYFDDIDFKPCKAQKDINTPDDCVTKGAYFENGDLTSYEKLFAIETNKMSEKEIKAKIKELLPKVIPNGVFSLSTFYSESKKSATNGLKTISHELGHACSSIKTQLELKRVNSVGALSKLKKMNIKSDDECEIDSGSLEVMAKNFSNNGYSLETIKCVTDVAQKASENRFTSGKCEGGCPLLQLEEIFADSIAFMSTTNNIYPVVVNSCLAKRDQIHPLGMDGVNCFLMTNWFKEQLEYQLKCKKN